MNNFYSDNYIEYESDGDRNKNLSLDEYLNKIKPYLRDIIIDLQKFDTCKIQLTIVIDFISSIDSEKECVMHSKSDNIKLTSYNDTNEIQEQPSSGVLRKKCSENMQQIYRRTSMPKCDFDKVAKQLY